MKKTYNINIAGRPFIIDSDAYDMLHDYLETLRHAFSSQADSTELLDDIEARIAEILTENLEQRNTTIVTIDEIKAIITRIGRPEEMIELDATLSDTPDGETIPVEAAPLQTPPPVPPADIRKRLFRDPSDKLLGGVCSGLAAYLGIDPTWVRLAVVVLCFLSFSTVAIVYFILWIVVPEASTPLQRLQMRGEAPTMTNIGQAVTSEFSSGPAQDTQGVRGFVGNLMRVCAFLAKVLIVMLCVVFTPVLIGLIIAFFACLVALLGISFAPFDLVSQGMVPQHIDSLVIWSMALILVIGIPIAAIIIMIWNSYNKRPSMSRPLGLTLVVIWVVAIAVGLITGFYMRPSLTDLMENVAGRIENVQEITDEASDSVDEMTENIRMQVEAMETQADSIALRTDSIASAVKSLPDGHN